MKNYDSSIELVDYDNCIIPIPEEVLQQLEWKLTDELTLEIVNGMLVVCKKHE